MIDKIEIIKLKQIARDAGEVIIQIYESTFSIEYKDDSSPLTQADIQANSIICNALNALYPNIPILSEENKIIEYEERVNWEYYWCIDPIDGTKEFIKKNGEFTINIALIHHNTPVIGIVYAPAINAMYYAKKGHGAYLNGLALPIYTNKEPEKRINVVASKSHLSQETQEFIYNLKSEKIILNSKGSSLKLCMIASGEADIYPRLSPTMEWDTAAADAIVRESGKMTFNHLTHSPLLYNKRNLLNPYFIVK